MLATVVLSLVAASQVVAGPVAGAEKRQFGIPAASSSQQQQQQQQSGSTSGFFSIQTSPPDPPSSSIPSSTPFYGFPTTSSTSSQAAFPSESSSASAPQASLFPGQNQFDSKRFLIYNADQVHYPFTVHPPDRETRGLYPLAEPWPMILSLSGSGGRGPASEAETLSGFDGTSRFIRQYNTGNMSAAHCLAAEEFLVVTPICPNETAQADANWDVSVMGNIIAQVAATYPIDTTRIYLTSYSMGARAAWNMLVMYPDTFAGTIISSGSTFLQQYQMGPLLGQSIRNYYGSVDELGLANASVNTQQAYDAALAKKQASNTSSLLRTRSLETIGPIIGADHLDMTYKPWDEEVLTDGFQGALAWLQTQSRPEAVLPAYNASVCTTCIPPSSNVTKY